MYHASRLSYEYHRMRQIGNGMYVLHSCDNGYCVNPSHLREGTQLENCQDKELRDRPQRFNSGVKRKLTVSAVAEATMEYHSGVQMATLARKYGVHFKTMDQAIRGVTWKRAHGR